MKIAISQRVDTIAGYQETRDSLDSNWYTALRNLLPDQCLFHPVANQPEDVLKLFEFFKPDLLVLTGGNDIYGFENATNVSVDRDQTEIKLLECAKAEQVPVLGVCRGFQMLNHFLGGSSIEVQGHVAVQHQIFSIDTSDRMIVNSYHGYGIPRSELASDFEKCYQDADGNVEAALHKTLPWLGIMWHPERAGNEEAAVNWLKRELASLMEKDSDG